MNSLGTLGGFEVQPEEPGQVYGMRHATGTEGGNSPAPPVKTGVEGVQAVIEEQKRGRPPSVRRTPAEISELAKDTEAALGRLEKARGKGHATPELVGQIRCELLNQLLAEYTNVEREKAKSALLGLWSRRWHRHVTRVDTDKFENVVSARAMGNELAMTPEKEFAAVARRLFDELRSKWPEMGIE